MTREQLFEAVREHLNLSAGVKIIGLDVTIETEIRVSSAPPEVLPDPVDDAPMKNRKYKKNTIAPMPNKRRGGRKPKPVPEHIIRDACSSGAKILSMLRLLDKKKQLTDNQSLALAQLGTKKSKQLSIDEEKQVCGIYEDALAKAKAAEKL